MTSPATMLWFARHELRLAIRDLLATLRAGRRRVWLPLLVVAELLLHLVAYELLAPFATVLAQPDKATLVAATGAAFFSWLLFLSQAMESATRGFYARGDLDLILSSPAPARHVFAIRIAAIAVSTAIMALLLACPAIDALAVAGGARFLSAYALIAAMAASAAATAVIGTALLFRLVGAKRTRLVAQIAAAVVGAGVVVGVQVAAVVGTGAASRMALLRSPALIAAAPGLASPLWWPLRAATGDPFCVAVVLASAAALLALTMWFVADMFAHATQMMAGLPGAPRQEASQVAAFQLRSRATSLRRKEWLLLKRDPWLVSQTLMQILYLVPPALMLWYSYGSDIGGVVVIVPTLVMAAGQLAGGLAWLAISGEDLPDLVASAPITPGAILRAKVEAVLVAVALPLAPVVVVIAWMSLRIALLTVVGAALAATGACAVQFIFRVKGRRSSFRRRQTSSRIATFAEAFVSISVAAASGLAAAGLWIAVLPLAVATGVLLGSRVLAAPAT